MEKKNNFTKEEIDAALKVRESMMSEEMPNEVKSIYMAGEICMWLELQKASQFKSSETYTEEQLREAIENYNRFTMIRMGHRESIEKAIQALKK